MHDADELALGLGLGTSDTNGRPHASHDCQTA